MNMNTFLQVGCGPKRKERTTKALSSWNELCCGFTQKVLTATLQASGFKSVVSISRGYPYFELWAVASKAALSKEQLQALALEHMTPV